MKTKVVLGGLFYALACITLMMAAEAASDARLRELVQTLEDENGDVALAAAAALGQMGKPAVTPLVEALDSPKKNVRQLAALAVGRIGAPAQEAEPKLVRLLEDREGRVQDAAAAALGCLKPQQKETIPALVKVMQSHDGNYISTSAAMALGKFGPEVAPILLDSFRDDREKTAVWAFQAMGPRAVPALVKAMNDPSPGVQAGVFGSLRRIGVPGVPELVQLLQSDQIGSRRGAARALGWLGHSDAAATAALVNALHSPDDELREVSLYALGQLRAKNAVLAIRNALDDKNARVRFEAKVALQALGEDVQSDARPGPREMGEIGRFIGHTESVTYVAFLPDGRHVFSAEGSGSCVRLWDVATAKEIRCLGIDDARGALAASTDGRWVACGAMYQRLRLINFETGEERRQWRHQGHLVFAAIRPGTDQIVYVDMPQVVGPWTLHVCDVASGKESHSFQIPFLRGVTRLACSPDGRLLLGVGISDVALDSYPKCRIWDVDTDKVVFEQALSGAGIDAAAFSSDGGKVCIADSSRREGLALWDVNAGKILHQLPNSSRSYGMALSHDCDRALVGRGDGAIDLFDLPHNRVVTTFHTRGGIVSSIAFSPDGRYAVSGGADRLVRLWRLPD